MSANQPSYTPSERIRQLSEIDIQIATLLQSAGLALQSITDPTSTSDVESSQASFLTNVENYFKTLSAIDVNIRRQIYALQEAGLIAEGTVKDAKDAMTKTDLRTAEGGGVETSWLNSRAQDKVGQRMEKELWGRAREMIDRLDHGDSPAEGANGLEDGMDVEHKEEERISEEAG